MQSSAFAQLLDNSCYNTRMKGGKKKTKSTKKSRHLDQNTVLIIKQLVLGVLIFGFLGMVGTGVWYGTRIDRLTIDKVVVQGGATIPHEEIKLIVEQKLEGEYFGFVPRRFAFLYPRSEMVSLLEQFDRIKEFSIERSSGDALVVNFTEYKPDNLWCGREDTSNCYFLDETGYAFGKAPNLSGGSFLRFYTDNDSLDRGVQAIISSDYSMAVILTELLRDQGWSVSALEIDAAQDAFLYLTDGGELKTSLLQPPLDTVENLLTIVGSQEFGHIEPGNFEYIDLRFGNKVFVKEESEEVASTTEEVIE